MRVNTKLSIENYAEIFNEEIHASAYINQDITITEQFDFCIFMGDFNYRLNKDEEFITNCIVNNRVADLHEFDQMIMEKKAGRLMINNFKEGPVNFPPTYKYKAGTNTYHLGRNDKMPGWTDRIL